MSENDSRPLRLVGEDDSPPPPAEPATEAYWDQVRALRADLAALRPAN